MLTIFKFTFKTVATLATWAIPSGLIYLKTHTGSTLYKYIKAIDLKRATLEEVKSAMMQLSFWVPVLFFEVPKFTLFQWVKFTSGSTWGGPVAMHWYDMFFGIASKVNNETLLMAFAQQGDSGSIEKILPIIKTKFGDEKLTHYVNQGNGDGYTALHYVAEQANVDIIELLLKHGADPDKRNQNGLRGLDLAVKQYVKYHELSKSTKFRDPIAPLTSTAILQQITAILQHIIPIPISTAILQQIKAIIASAEPSDSAAILDKITAILDKIKAIIASAEPSDSAVTILDKIKAILQKAMSEDVDSKKNVSDIVDIMYKIPLMPIDIIFWMRLDLDLEAMRKSIVGKYYHAIDLLRKKTKISNTDQLFIFLKDLTGSSLNDLLLGKLLKSDLDQESLAFRNLISASIREHRIEAFKFLVHPSRLNERNYCNEHGNTPLHEWLMLSDIKSGYLKQVLDFIVSDACRHKWYNTANNDKLNPLDIALKNYHAIAKDVTEDNDCFKAVQLLWDKTEFIHEEVKKLFVSVSVVPVPVVSVRGIIHPGFYSLHQAIGCTHQEIIDEVERGTCKLLDKHTSSFLGELQDPGEEV